MKNLSSYRDRSLRIMTLALGIFAGMAGSFALACNVPVFRYALEHWRPDAYRAVLVHRGALSTDDQKRLAGLQSRADESHINVSIRTIDLDASPDPADQELLATLGDAPLPRLIVQYPPHLHLHEPVWSGPFGEKELSATLDSPARREILKRLTGGQTAVWLMVDSSDAANDDVAATTLESEIKALHTTLKLPELSDSPDDMIQDGPPLRVEFSMLRVRRDDPAEQALVAMLVACETDLAGLDEPMVFPLFGRSRAMLPLVGAGISPDNIRGSAKFLAGACSCQVKELNPGFDLLLTADWDELLSWAKSPAFATGESPDSPSGEAELVPIPGGSRAAVESPAPAAATIPVVETHQETTAAAAKPTAEMTPAPATGPTGVSSNMLAILGGLVLLALIATVAAARRNRA